MAASLGIITVGICSYGHTITGENDVAWTRRRNGRHEPYARCSRCVTLATLERAVVNAGGSHRYP